MKAIALFAALLAASTAPVDSFLTSNVTALSLENGFAAANSATPATRGDAPIARCFPSACG